MKIKYYLMDNPMTEDADDCCAQGTGYEAVTESEIFEYMTRKGSGITTAEAKANYQEFIEMRGRQPEDAMNYSPLMQRSKQHGSRLLIREKHQIMFGLLRTKKTYLYLHPPIRNKMEESERIQKQKELIELIGRQHEKEGYQPVTGRILGLLMVLDKEEYTFDEIVAEMKISKSTASNALKNLKLRGVIEYITYPGDRKRYFRFKSGDMDDLVSEIERKINQSIAIINKIIELKKDPNSRNSVFLKNILKSMKFLVNHLDQFQEENTKVN